ncbi:MAG: hypothetical protein RL757_788 [Bacteroidota bacterium]|jgi:hypothetical protein
MIVKIILYLHCDLCTFESDINNFIKKTKK